jgi:ubiquinone/menaquinone biosynthesis C-methylase UbiE
MATRTLSLEHLNTLADSTRSRILLVLERSELTVGELCAALQLPQSTVSRHLKVLGDDGWVSSRAEGTSRYYRIERVPDSQADRLWSVVRDDVAGSSAARNDATRVQSLLAARRERSREFFATAAGEWESMRLSLFGSRIDLQLALAMLPPGLVVGDLGCGTGHLSALLAPHVRRVIAVDGAEAMLASARARLEPRDNVEFRQGDLEQLPLDDAVLDVATLALVLHHVSEPGRAIGEARRALRPGGRLLVIDMLPHERDDLQQRMGHIWRGFAGDQVHDWMTAAGLSGVWYRPLPADPDAKGPALFIAGGTRAPDS